MADFGTPVANQTTYDPQGGLKTLSSLLGIKQQQANLQQTQQTTSQRYGIAQWMKNFDPSKHVSADGTLDLNAVLGDPSLRQVAGDQYPELVQQFTQLKQGQLQNKLALIQVNDAARKGFQETISALRTDPDIVKDTPEGRQKLETAINQYASQGPDAARIAGIYGPQAENVPSGKLAQYLSNVQLQAEDAATQASKQAPKYQQAGATQVQTETQAAGAGENGGPSLTASPDIKNTVAPTTKQSITDTYGRVFTFNPQTGNYEPAKVSGGIGAAAPGETTAVTEGAKSDNDLFNTVTNAAKQAPQNKNILANLSKLADSGVFTGTGSQDVASLEGALGQIIPGFKGAGDAAADRQMMGKFTQQLAMSMTAQNYGTDQARDMVEHAIPNADNMTPQAIKKAAAYIQGQQQIAQARGAVADAYAQAHGGSTIGLRHVDTEFMSKIDPRMFDYVSVAGDKDKRAEFLKQFKTPQEKQDFLSKVAYINHLGGFSYEQP